MSLASILLGLAQAIGTDIKALVAGLAAKADDSAVVKLTGNQTVAGTKTFSTAIALGSGGTGATTAAGARTALGVTATGSDTAYAYRANNLSDLANAGTARTNLGLAIGTNIAEASHANLTAFAGLSLIADRLPYANGTGTLALATLTAFGRSLIDDADAAAGRTTLGLGTVATLNLHVGTTAPGSPASGDLWVDTN